MEIDRDAPVTAAAEGHIDAPRDLVWEVQADVEDWPNWNPDVTAIRLLGPREPGTIFKWKAGGARIESEFRELEPPRRISWTGKTLGIRAAHVWDFADSEAGGTLVRTEESFEGILARLLAGPMRRILESSLEKGVEALRRECERKSGRGREKPGEKGA